MERQKPQAAGGTPFVPHCPLGGGGNGSRGLGPNLELIFPPHTGHGHGTLGRRALEGLFVVWPRLQFPRFTGYLHQQPIIMSYVS